MEEFGRTRRKSGVESGGRKIEWGAMMQGEIKSCFSGGWEMESHGRVFNPYPSTARVSVEFEEGMLIPNSSFMEHYRSVGYRLTIRLSRIQRLEGLPTRNSIQRLGLENSLRGSDTGT